jgi:hypothetical protein
MKVTHAGRQITVNVRADGDGLVSHAGSALLAQVADKSGLTRVQTTGRPPNSGPPSRPAPDPPAATREWVASLAHPGSTTTATREPPTTLVASDQSESEAVTTRDAQPHAPTRPPSMRAVPDPTAPLWSFGRSPPTSPSSMAPSSPSPCPATAFRASESPSRRTLRAVRASTSLTHACPRRQRSGPSCECAATKS